MSTEPTAAEINEANRAREAKAKLDNLRYICGEAWDQFAAAALAGLLASPIRKGNAKEYADDAFDFADAMILERAKRKEGA